MGRLNRQSAMSLDRLESRQLFAVTGPPVEGKPWNYEVAFGSHMSPHQANAGDFSVSIDWGDGVTTTERNIQEIYDDIFKVYATHTYRDSGSLQGTRYVTIHNHKSGQSWVQTQIGQRIVDAPIAVTAFDFNAPIGGTFSGVVGSFTSECVYDTASEFKAYVYTPGARTDATITGGGGNFTVSAKNVPVGMRPGAQDFRVYVMSTDTVNKAATGTMFLSQQTSSPLSPNAKQTSDQIATGLNNTVKSPVLQGWAEQMNWSGTQLQGAVQDAVNNFATGISTSQKPTPISISNPAKYPFSRSFFDAGRMLRGIASVPGDLFKLGAYIVQNPQIFSKENLNKIAQGAVDGANKAIGTVKDPVRLMGAIQTGFNAFANVDAADFGGKWIGGAAMGKITSAVGGNIIANSPLGKKFGATLMYTDETAEVFAVTGETWTTIYGKGFDVRWINDALKGVNIQSNGTSCVNTVRAIENKLKYNITASTPVPNSGLQSLKVLEDQFGKTFAKSTMNDIVKQLTKNPNKEARGIIALTKPGLHLVGNKYVFRPGHMLNVVFKPGQGVWVLDGQLATAYHIANPETAKLLGAYSKSIEWIRTF